MLIAILFLLKTEDKSQKAPLPNVLYQVILTWDGESDDDHDLWVKAASGHIVSFNNREGGQGSLVSLNHDALGRARNNNIPDENGVVANMNEEVVSFRGVVEGENIVNVHTYLKVDKSPTKVMVKLIKIKPYQEIIIKEKLLSFTGEEKTFFRFKTDKQGNITEISELPIILTRPY